jgi:uncharacterized protein YkwD
VRSSSDAPEAKNNGESSIGEPSSIPGAGGAASGSDGGTPRDPGLPAGSGGSAVTPPTPPTPPAPPPRCSLIFNGGGGGDPDGRIPVCCNATEQENAANNEVYRLLNQHRQNNGRAPVARDPLLESAAMGHCLHMATHGFFDHQAPEPAIVTPWARAERCGTTAGGENIAMGQRSPMEVVVGWINSPGHNANMLNGSFKRVGMGHCGTHWVQLFGY